MKIAAETGLMLAQVGDNTQQSSTGYTFLPCSTGDNLGATHGWTETFPPSGSTWRRAPLHTARVTHEIGHALG